MKRRWMLSLGCVLSIALAGGSARADLNIFLGDLNQQASVNRNDYGSRLSSQFGVPVSQVDSILRAVQSPADAFMCLQLGRMLNIAPDRVLHTYQANQGQGWGVTAQRLGIKPGSPEFHALKNGDFVFTGRPDDDRWKKHPGYEQDHGKGKKGGAGPEKGGKKDAGYGPEEKEKGHGKGGGKGHK
jgi:hypothetical protein